MHVKVRLNGKKGGRKIMLKLIRNGIIIISVVFGLLLSLLVFFSTKYILSTVFCFGLFVIFIPVVLMSISPLLYRFTGGQIGEPLEIGGMDLFDNITKHTNGGTRGSQVPEQNLPVFIKTSDVDYGNTIYQKSDGTITDKKAHRLAMKNHAIAEENFYRLGSELALEMGLWKEDEDYFYQDVTADLKSEEMRLKQMMTRADYQAIAIETDKGILFKANVKPRGLRIKEIIRKAEEIQGDYIRSKQIRLLKDTLLDTEIPCVTYGGAVFHFSLDDEMETIFFQYEDPLEKGWTVESTDDIPFRPDDLTIMSGVNEAGRNVGMTFKEVSGMVVGGLPGSGKSASMISAMLKLVESDMADILVIDGKGTANEWDIFYENGLIDLINYEEDPDENKSNLDEILEKIDEFRSEIKQRAGTFQENYGESNFWNIPLEDRPKLKLLVIDECQVIYDGSGANGDERIIIDKIVRKVADFVRVFRSAGACAVSITQKPTRDAIPTAIRDNSSLRMAFRLKTDSAEVATLGDSEGSLIRATDIPNNLQGTAVTENESGDRQRVRYAYVSEKLLRRELERISKEKFG